MFLTLIQKEKKNKYFFLEVLPINHLLEITMPSLQLLTELEDSITT